MTPATIGLAIGLAFGVLNYILAAKLSERVERPETKKALSIFAKLDLVVLPVLGWVIGGYVYG